MLVDVLARRSEAGSLPREAPCQGRLQSVTDSGRQFYVGMRRQEAQYPCHEVAPRRPKRASMTSVLLADKAVVVIHYITGFIFYE